MIGLVVPFDQVFRILKGDCDDLVHGFYITVLGKRDRVKG
jgi:hypothetical protein